MANELELKYGCNPNQKPARIFMKEGELPIEVLNGRPGYINLLDAFNSWQLVKELKEATGLPAAASFKHVSPAGAAVAVEMSDTLKKIYFVDDMKLFHWLQHTPAHVAQTVCHLTETLSHCPTPVMKKQHASSTVKYPTASLLLTILPKHWRF